ncbi:hypothetical protein MKW94_012173, partial [Papaver nudicaule]|nr:hypothetical protein [Papaver nudicaule]
MEKMNLVRNAWKAVYTGSGYRTVVNRGRYTAEEFVALTDEFSKVMAHPNLKNALASSPKEAQHVRQMRQGFDESVRQLAIRCEHFA